jgi:hypothetical protein
MGEKKDGKRGKESENGRKEKRGRKRDQKRGIKEKSGRGERRGRCWRTGEGRNIPSAPPSKQY